MYIAGHQPWSPSLQSLHKEMLLSAAHFLSQELDPLGIKVSTVSIGPSAPARSSRITHVEARCVFCSRCRNLVINAAAATALRGVLLASLVLVLGVSAVQHLDDFVPCVLH